MKHLWAILGWKLHKKNKKLLPKTEYLRLLKETLEEIPQDDILELISSMPKRVLALKNVNGISTKY